MTVPLALDNHTLSPTGSLSTSVIGKRGYVAKYVVACIYALPKTLTFLRSDIKVPY